MYIKWEEVPFSKGSLTKEEQEEFEDKFFDKSESEEDHSSEEEQQHDLIPAVVRSFEELLTKIDEFDRDGSVEVYRHNTQQTILIIINYDPVIQFIVKEFDDAYEVQSYEVCFKYVEPNKDAWIKSRLDKKMFKVYTEDEYSEDQE